MRDAAPRAAKTSRTNEPAKRERSSLENARQFLSAQWSQWVQQPGGVVYSQPGRLFDEVELDVEAGRRHDEALVCVSETSQHIGVCPHRNGEVE